MSALDKSSPAEIVGKVMCDYTIKTAHPFLESAIVGIDDLNMVDPGEIVKICHRLADNRFDFSSPTDCQTNV